MSGLSLPVFVRLIANLYRDEPDDHVLSIGDWLPSPPLSPIDMRRMEFNAVEEIARKLGASLHCDRPTTAI